MRSRRWRTCTIHVCQLRVPLQPPAAHGSVPSFPFCPAGFYQSLSWWSEACTKHSSSRSQPVHVRVYVQYICGMHTCTVHGLLTSAAAATLRVGWQLLPSEEGLSLGSPYSGGYSCMGRGQHCQTETTHASTQSSGKLPPALSTYPFCILCPSLPLCPSHLL